MNVLNFALRAAPMFLTESDPTKLSMDDGTLFADALSNGIADYWAGAPAWVTAPEGENSLVTVDGTETVALPAHFESLQRAPWLRASTSETWSELTEMFDDPADGGVNEGRPTHYRIINKSAAPVWDDATGADPADALLQLWPVPDAVYSISIKCAYHTPRIRLKHLAGSAVTISLPIPDDHLIRIVLPLCGPHMLTHPLVKTQSAQLFLAAAENARRALSELTQRRSVFSGSVGTPIGF